MSFLLGRNKNGGISRLRDIQPRTTQALETRRRELSWGALASAASGSSFLGPGAQLCGWGILLFLAGRGWGEGEGVGENVDILTIFSPAAAAAVKRLTDSLRRGSLVFFPFLPPCSGPCEQQCAKSLTACFSAWPHKSAHLVESWPHRKGGPESHVAGRKGSGPVCRGSSSLGGTAWTPEQLANSWLRVCSLLWRLSTSLTEMGLILQRGLCHSFF